jgi:alpha-L-fucosidase 2
LRLASSNTTASSLPTNERLAAFKNNTNDPGLAALYFQFGRYLLISSSRPGSMPANLQGLWAWQMSPPWNADFHTNINVQMNYWPAETTNLPEMHLPLFDLMDLIAVTGNRTAKATYGANGWVVHHLTDAWGRTAPADGPIGVWPMGAAWLARHPWEHYEFTGDKKFLSNRAWPLMKGAARFIMDFLVEAPQGTAFPGKLVTAPSVSPENGFRMVPKGPVHEFTYGSTMDMEIIRDLLQNCIQATKVLNIEPAFRAECERTLARLIPLQISKSGRIQEWIEDYEETSKDHRHVSHLYALYPAADISPTSTPALAEAARKVLAVRGDAGTGWSLAWKIDFWARLHDGDHAHLLLSNLLKNNTLPNLFDTHPPFQIDGNFGATAAFAEMLLQSHVPDGINGWEIELLPALPSAWPEGKVTGLRARGGITVGIDWKQGKLATVHLLPAHDGKLRVRSGSLVKVLDVKKGKALTLNAQLITQ